MIQLAKPQIGRLERRAVNRVLRSLNLAQGPEVKSFESEFSELVDGRECVAVNSGTSALHLCLLSLGVGVGDEVIVPSFTFAASANVIRLVGATPVFVDINPKTYCADVTSIESAITPKTKAIIFVDLYGQTIALQRLRALVPGIPLIQDAAQSAGCRYKNQPIGNQADLTCFSFYPGKNLGAMGDAGAVTGRQKLIANIKLLRDHGRKEKYLHEIVGWNERLDSIQAAILSAKFDFLDAWNQKRVKNAQRYMELLKHCDKIQLPQLNNVSSHVYNQFVITTDRRNDLYEYLYNQGIQAGIQFPLAMHQQPVYQSMITVSLPNSERLAAECISLPVHAHLNPGDVDTVAQAILDFFN
jgi:dTDP-4-amino-4,6-dideoxygalactose transaminase